MFHLSRFNLHVNEEACPREEGQFFALADIRAKKVGLPKPIYDFLSTLE